MSLPPTVPPSHSGHPPDLYMRLPWPSYTADLHRLVRRFPHPPSFFAAAQYASYRCLHLHLRFAWLLCSSHTALPVPPSSHAFPTRPFQSLFTPIRASSTINRTITVLQRSSTSRIGVSLQPSSIFTRALCAVSNHYLEPFFNSSRAPRPTTPPSVSPLRSVARTTQLFPTVTSLRAL